MDTHLIILIASFPHCLSRTIPSSIDTTCTVWDMEKEVVDTQLIAHDKEVYDIAWGGVGLFASVSGEQHA